MEKDLEYLLYGSTLLLGIGCCSLAILHRGNTHFDHNKGITVAKGNGVASKIIKKFPKYSRISPVVDHTLAGIGLPAVIAGASGLMIQGSLDILSNETRSYDNYDLMRPYKAGVLMYWATEAAWEGFTLIKRKMQVGANEFMQYATDVSVPLMFLYAADNVTKMI
jgi:hypothetical protein